MNNHPSFPSCLVLAAAKGKILAPFHEGWDWDAVVTALTMVGDGSMDKLPAQLHLCTLDKQVIEYALSQCHDEFKPWRFQGGDMAKMSVLCLKACERMQEALVL